MHFLIWIPGGREADDLARVGLSDLVPNALGKFTDRGRGPDGGNGVMCGWPVDGAICPLSYMPDDQEWIPAAPFGGMDAGRYLVGFWKGKLPTPGELRRPRFYGGHDVPLGDGNIWQVPDCSQLPHAYVVDDDGQWRMRAARGFERLISTAVAWEARFTTPGAKLPPIEVLEYALQVIAINHRMTREVASHLQLFTDGVNGTLRTCFAHCIGAGGAL